MWIFELCENGQWSPDPCGIQDRSNGLPTREQAEAELPNLAAMMNVALSALRAREVDEDWVSP